MARALLCVALAALVASASASPDTPPASAACVVTAPAEAQTEAAFVLNTQGCRGASYTPITISHINGTSTGVVQDSGRNLDDGYTDATDGDHTFNLLRQAPAIMQHGSYFAIIGGTAYGPFATKCYPSSSYTPPKLVPETSKVEAFPGTNVPSLTLTFTADKGDNSVAFEFLFDKQRLDSRCGVNFNYGTESNARFTPFFNEAHRSGGANGAWSMISNTGGCADGVTYQYQVANFNNALTNCGWKRIEGTGVTTFETTVLATSLQQGSRIRNVLVTRSLETSVTVGINYLTNISATNGPLRVFGPVIEQATLQKQVFDPVSQVVSWVLLTSVQGPYQLVQTSNPAADPSDGITANDFHALAADEATFLGLPNGADVTGENSEMNAHTNVQSGLAKCVLQQADGNLINGIHYASTVDAYAACTQRWFATAQKPCPPGADPSANLNIAWSLTLGVTCHHTFSGSCKYTPQTTQVTVSWNSYSDNYCPRVIDTEASTATLKVYQNSDFTGEQTQFVFGTASYFEATATSSINIEDLETEKITILSGGAAQVPAGPQVVYNKIGFDGSNGWWSTGLFANNISLHAGNPLGFLDNFYFAKNVSVVWPPNPLERKTRWAWVWGSDNSAATGDFPTDATVQVDLRIRYTDQGAAPKRGLDALSVRFVPHLSATSAGATAQANVGVTARATSTGAAPTSGASSSSAMSAQTIAIGAAVVGGVALVAAGVAVARRRTVVAKSTATNMESVEMRGLPTATNVV